MKKCVSSIILLILMVSAFAQVWVKDEWKLGTVSLGPEFGFGDNGHLDISLGARFNTPGFEYLVFGINFQGGIIFHDTDSLFYVDDQGHLFHRIEDWSNINYEFLFGAEFAPRAKINPYFLTGIGIWRYGFEARDTILHQSIDVSSSDNGVAIPLIFGCDFALSKHFAITGYVKATPYAQDLEVTITDFDQYGYPVSSRDESVGKWRGYVHFGVNLSVLISIPLPTDSDGDGVWDDFDECPNTPPGTIVNERGCPYKKPGRKPEINVEKQLQEKGAYTTNEIHFEFNSDKINPDSYPVLDQVGQVLERHKDWKLEIAGHTDSIGTEEYNLNLSQRRAESVREYILENFDVFARNLIAQGYGESKPIADNGSSEGRTKNRRVEFKIIK
ncbi:hypothetical protein DRQ33_00225 [bacterium]|nr:MAG: hypothetical protein DRQ33_00225 [bacterium]